MSRVISFRDLLSTIPALKGKNEIELLDPAMDPVINRYLQQLGFDMDYAIVYEASKHRDMAGKVAVGFRAVGEISINSAWINSGLASFEDRMMAAYNKDKSLAIELAQLGGNSVSFRSTEYDGDTDDQDDFPEGLIEPDYQDVLAQILTLEKIRESIRGDGREEDGSYKLPVL